MSDITVSAVTLMGNKHKGRGVPCEDSSIAVQRDGVSCVVVADGAGSKQYTHARFGSKSACDTVSELLIDHFDALYYENREAAVKSIIIAAVHVGFSKLIEEYKLDSLDRLSCTLLFCAVKDRRVIVGHIGDGLIACVSRNGVRPITMPQNGTNASSTYFVTAPHAADYLRLIKTTTDDIHGIALMTDGVQDSVYDENSGLVKPVVASMVETAAKGREKSEQEINSILSQYIVGASNNSDDASFGIMLLDKTQGPDAGKLPKSADRFGKSEETFKDLQTKMLPEVKKAKQIITSCGTNPPPKTIAPGDDEDVKTSDTKPVAVKKDEKEYAADETKMKIKSNKDDKSSWILKAVALTELVAIIILLIKMFILGG
ncbi:MAG: protein phosphatase 2C domain-containing protein [Clostridiales bacterium]|nr:protein phosphatase 2C domain-containing protein [Clostridiales bacterium]